MKKKSIGKNGAHIHWVPRLCQENNINNKNRLGEKYLREKERYFSASVSTWYNTLIYS